MFLSKQDVQIAVRDALNARAGTEIGKREAEITKLKGEIEDLKLSKDRKEEEFSRREREVEHKIGLERLRQEQEVAAQKREAEQAKKQVELTVREANLEAEKIRFADQMNFHQKQMEGQISGLQQLVGQLLERLPSMEIKARISNGDNK